MRFEIGQKVGDYEVLDVIDASQGGRMFKVRNVLAQRMECLKVFPKEFQDDRERADRFLREIKIHARLSHPNIETFYNASMVNEQLVMTTELLEGFTLAQLLEAGPMAWHEAAGFMHQALAALGYAHENGVVHRMITPANITITPDKVVKITGFDLAKTTTDPQLTKAGVAMGSLDYMSPEQVKGLPQIDARSDIYSLGAVFYHALTGKPPFQSQSQFDVMMAHVNKAPAPPSASKSDIPPEIDAMVMKALAKEPAERFQTAAEFAQTIESVAPDVKAQAAAQSVAAPAVEPAPKPPAIAPLVPPFSQIPPPATGFSRELIALGAFTFLIVAAAVFALLTLTKF
jgi:serine/threonine protein kinase